MRNPLILSLLNAFSGIAAAFSGGGTSLWAPKGTSARHTRTGAKGKKGEHLRNPYDIYGSTFCRQSDKDDNLPRGYAGAKFARKCAKKQLTLRHITQAA